MTNTFTLSLGCFFVVVVNFWLPWVFTAMRGLSLVAESRGYSLVVVRGLLIAVDSLVVQRGL